MEINKSREELIIEQNKKNEVYNSIKKSAIEYITKIFNDFINNNGLGGYCHLDKIYNINTFRVVVPRCDKEGEYCIEFYLDDYNDDDLNLKINYSMLGSIRSNENDKVDYMIVLGEFARNFVVIEKDIKKFDWDNYVNAIHDLKDVEYKIQMKEQEEEEIKKNEEISKIKDKLIVGQKISFGKITVYNSVTEKWIEIDDIHTVEKVMNKNVKFSACANRVKKEIVFNQIYTKHWKFVD